MEERIWPRDETSDVEEQDPDSSIGAIKAATETQTLQSHLLGLFSKLSPIVIVNLHSHNSNNTPHLMMNTCLINVFLCSFDACLFVTYK